MPPASIVLKVAPEVEGIQQPISGAMQSVSETEDNNQLFYSIHYVKASKHPFSLGCVNPLYNTMVPEKWMSIDNWSNSLILTWFSLAPRPWPCGCQILEFWLPFKALKLSLTSMATIVSSKGSFMLFQFISIGLNWAFQTKPHARVWMIHISLNQPEAGLMSEQHSVPKQTLFPPPTLHRVSSKMESVVGIIFHCSFPLF